MPVPAIPKLSEGQLDPLFRRLNLAHTRRIYQEVADRAEKENWTYRDFLALLLAEEVAHRKQTRLQRCTRHAHFPFFKTIDEFDFTLQSTLRQSLLGSYLGPDFVTEGRSLILYGKAGRGKTHLAVAIGYRAIQNGFETLCVTAAKLIEDLSNASAKGLLHQSLSAYTRPHVLVIDEIGYLSYGPDAANVLFHVVNDRHLRKRPMIFTTNKPLSVWGKVLHDEDLAAAILDRVLERGRFVPLDGPSGRTRHLNLEEVSPSNADRLRISGINGSEFSEPTRYHSGLSDETGGSTPECPRSPLGNAQSCPAEFLDNPYPHNTLSGQLAARLHQVQMWSGLRLRTAPLGGDVKLKVAGMRCLFKSEQFFKSPKATLRGLDRPRRCCMNRTKDRSRIESAILVNLLAIRFVGP
jgi:DNA replication protein DnaC